ncbi:MAG TPA: ABC transporter permease [Candidatus Mediterraneibacter cottocaccae]|nr:ABC transporter permease [Candidatus Mediterraneibacter cottocaccae]
MTSEKYFSKWIREAGRGHAAAFLSWGLLLIYGFLAAAQLTLDTNYNFFGAGSRELIWISEILGLALGFIEFFYLFQPKKLDFYYSLPVKRETVFWSRYVHGLIHFLIPMAIVLTACGLYQSMIDVQFAAYAAGYTGTAVMISALVFLVFYHLAVLSAAVCGHGLSAALTCLFLIVGGGIFTGYTLTAYAEHYFHTYYRIPLLENLTVVLDPMALGGALGGGSYYEKADLMRFFPEKGHILAAVLWIVFSFLLFAAAQKKRKTEGSGRAFALPASERCAQWVLSFFAGAWMGSFVTELMGNGGNTSGDSLNTALAGAAAVASGAIAAAVVHGVFGAVTGRNKGCFFRRRWQMVSSCGAAGIVAGLFLAGASVYDGYFPGEGEVSSMAVSIYGLGMNNHYYSSIVLEGGRMEIDDQLDQYVLSGEGKTAGTAWASSLLEKEKQGEHRDMSGEYTQAVVCWHMKDGSRKYRRYPVEQEDLMAFASVYDTEEYKEIAYPGMKLENTGEKRFSWNDGVTENVMKLSAEEKDTLVEAYREDILDMTMGQLTSSLPLGFVEITGENVRNSGQLVIYPFFERSCRLLEKYGVQTDRTIAGYAITSVEVRRTVFASGAGASGGVSMQWYDTPEEIEQWRQKLVPEELDLQPLLYPLNYSDEIRASVTDERSNSTLTVDCYQRIE